MREMAPGMGWDKKYNMRDGTRDGMGQKYNERDDSRDGLGSNIQ